MLLAAGGAAAAAAALAPRALAPAAAALSRGLATGAWFGHVEMAPRDPILGVTEKFLADSNPDKINLGVVRRPGACAGGTRRGVDTARTRRAPRRRRRRHRRQGAYRDDAGQPVVLGAVREAERRVAGSHFMEYLPIGGLKDFVSASVRLAYGEESPVVAGGQVAAVQSLSGTGSCRLFAEFQRRFMPGSAVYVPTPTWSNHLNIWHDAGVEVRAYRYYAPATRGLDFDGLREDVDAAPRGSVFLLHACAHNPTGVDPTPEQWSALSKLMLEKGHFAFFDMAYQGFATGDCARDAAAVATFVADGHRVGLSQSYAKNMGLYGQRVGCFSLVCDSPEEAARVESQMKAIARPIYSNPPLHGALLVSKILGDPALKGQWYQEVAGMASRIKDARYLLRRHLAECGSSEGWAHITDQVGMFCYTGMTGEMVDELAAAHSIYMTRNGRISMAGVNSGNVARLAQAMHAVTSK
ncbi:ASP1 [Scenedesmus sp. PABB004]|nr:ASP1 [Scenedesmus sp. PABB004]